MENEAKIFVIRFAGRFFYTRRINGVPMGSLYPSQAVATTYAVAFAAAQALRALGFVDAIVCNPNGLPASVNDIHNAQDVQESAEFIDVWGQPASEFARQ